MCIGNCTDENLVNEIFGSVSELARLVEENGDNFKYGVYTVVYNEDLDIHTFYI